MITRLAVYEVNVCVSVLMTGVEMRDQINDYLQRAIDHKETAPLNLLVRMVAEEVFRITEWLTLAAAIGVVGAKFNQPAITGVRYALVTVISAYLGARTVQWIGALAGPGRPILKVALIGVPFAVVTSFLIDILIKGLIQQALAS